MKSVGTSLILAGRLINGTGAPPIEQPAILVRDGEIVDIGHRDSLDPPDGARVIDLGNRTVMPGLIDAHMHFFGVPSHKLEQLPVERESYRVLRAAGEARKMLEAGITAARCLGSSITPDLRRAIDEGHVPGPRLMASGEFICSTDGTWDHISIPIDWARSLDMIADGIEGVREIVRRRVRRGANVIKVGLSKGGVDDRYHPWGDDPLKQVASYSLEEVKSLVAEAHLNKLKVSAHCIGDEAVRYALDGGVDVIEHGYGINEDTRKRLADSNSLVVSTISQLYFHRMSYEDYHYPHWHREIFERHIDRMRFDFERSRDAGVRYALGTDLVGFPTHPQWLAAREFEFAVDWGMDPMEAIVAGTQLAAEAMGMAHQIGALKKGYLADVIALAGNPLDDITELQRVEFVMLGGKVVREPAVDGGSA